MPNDGTMRRRGPRSGSVMSCRTTISGLRGSMGNHDMIDRKKIAIRSTNIRALAKFKMKPLMVLPSQRPRLLERRDHGLDNRRANAGPFEFE